MRAGQLTRTGSKAAARRNGARGRTGAHADGAGRSERERGGGRATCDARFGGAQGRGGSGSAKGRAKNRLLARRMTSA